MTEQRATRRHRIVLPALCWNRGRVDFYAVTDDISPAGIRFRSATVPFLDEALTCSIRHVGQLEGRVVQSGINAFVVRVLAKKQVVGEVARELRLLSEQQEQPVTTRAHPRIRPAHTDVTIELVDGRVLPAEILNVSASGIAFAMDEPVEIGALVLIGRTWARIARRFEGGLGANFVTPFDPRAISEQITL